MTDPTAPGEAAARSLTRLLAVMDKLRDPGGCPWDREQDLKSLRPYLIEEAYEVLEALEGLPQQAASEPARGGGEAPASDDRSEPGGRSATASPARGGGEAPHLKEELGDLLFQIVFQARIARENGWWSFADVADGIADKLVRRHPHVFPDDAGALRMVSGSKEVVKNWEELKAQEKTDRKSVLDGVPHAMPALVRAERLTEKAAAVGFDWPDLTGARAKLAEELAELDAAAKSGDQAHVEEELGDVLFALANVSRFLSVHPEDALRGAIEKFGRRFRSIEAALKARGKSPRESNLAEMDALWNDAKKAERA